METELIKNIVAEVMKLDPNEVTDSTTFVEDLGADSLDICRIIMNVEEKFCVILPKDSIYTVSTVGDIIAKIKKIKKA